MKKKVKAANMGACNMQGTDSLLHLCILSINPRQVVGGELIKIDEW